MRRIIVFTWLATGFFLQAAVYLRLAARLGIPQSPAYSNPRVPFAPALFIVGVIMVFLAPVIYELLPDRDRERRDSATAAVREPR
jgi:hypothetical protein